MPEVDHPPVTLSDLEGRDFAETWEVASVLGIADRRTVRSACREGRIPSVRVGAAYRIPVARLRQAASGQPASGAA